MMTTTTTSAHGAAKNWALRYGLVLVCLACAPRNSPCAIPVVGCRTPAKTTRASRVSEGVGCDTRSHVPALEPSAEALVGRRRRLEPFTLHQEGKTRDRRNLEWHNLAQQSVPNYAAVFEDPTPFFWVSCLALLACTLPLCPTTSIRKPPGNKYNHPSNHLEASKKQSQPTKGPEEMATIIHGLCVFLYHSLGIWYQILRWYSRIGVKFSPHFRNVAIPNSAHSHKHQRPKRRKAPFSCPLF